jgi:hypothetical protein
MAAVAQAAGHTMKSDHHAGFVPLFDKFRLTFWLGSTKKIEAAILLPGESYGYVGFVVDTESRGF